MSTKKPTLTLKFDNDSEDARKRMMERINNLRGNVGLSNNNKEINKDEAKESLPSDQKINAIKTKPVSNNEITQIDKPTKTQNSIKKKDTVNAEQLTKSENEKIETKDTANNENVQTAKTKTSDQNKNFQLVYEQYKVLKAYMQNTFPLCFTKPPSPLALRIHLQLRAYKEQVPDNILNNSNIAKFLYNYTKSIEYKKQSFIGAKRLNLDGSVAGSVTEEEAKMVAEYIDRYNYFKQQKLARKVAEYSKMKNAKKDKLANEVDDETPDADITPT